MAWPKGVSPHSTEVDSLIVTAHGQHKAKVVDAARISGDYQIFYPGPFGQTLYAGKLDEVARDFAGWNFHTIVNKKGWRFGDKDKVKDPSISTGARHTMQQTEFEAVGLRQSKIDEYLDKDPNGYPVRPQEFSWFDKETSKSIKHAIEENINKSPVRADIASIDPLYERNQGWLRQKDFMKSISEINAHRSIPYKNLYFIACREIHGEVALDMAKRLHITDPADIAKVAKLDDDDLYWLQNYEMPGRNEELSGVNTGRRDTRSVDPNKYSGWVSVRFRGIVTMRKMDVLTGGMHQEELLLGFVVGNGYFLPYHGPGDDANIRIYQIVQGGSTTLP
jgi:hypothetical protein